MGTATRNRKPLLPVQITASFVGGASREDVFHGAAVLAITDTATGEEQPYWCRAIYVGDTCTGFTLTKFGSGESYLVPRSLNGCTCPDHAYCPGRPNGCRHQVALRMALPTCTGTKPAGPRDRKTERDEITSAESEAA